jgi:hypothetical protein
MTVGSTTGLSDSRNFVRADAVLRQRPDLVRRDLQRLKETAGQIVGSIFYGTMLRSARESKFKGEYGHGGRGEDVFAAQLHGILAERAGNAKTLGVGEALYRRLAHQQSLMTQASVQSAG